MRISEFIKEGIRFGGAEDVEISNLQIDSRKCTSGSLYFALSGYSVDGHDYVENAKNNGAVAAVVERHVEVDIPQIVVKDSRLAMAYGAERFFGEPAKKLKLIGITGTNGKTSISYMLKAIANVNGISCGVIGTGGIWLDNEKLDIPFLTATTPDPIELQKILCEMVRRNAEWVVMEVTAHALALNKVAGMQFVTGGFTNLTQDHLDFFKTMENYGKAKEAFFENGTTLTGVTNIDDSFGRTLLAKDIPFMTYSVKEKADIYAQNIKLLPAKSIFDLNVKGEQFKVTTHTTGLFNVSNVLCAIGCAVSTGISPQNAVRGAESFCSVPGRFEGIDIKEKGVTVIIDYAHTPDGLENVLKAINGFKNGRLITVFGCGGNRDDAKRPIMGRLAGEASQLTVITSDNPRFEQPEAIISQIEEGIKQTKAEYICITDRREAIAYAVSVAKQGDVIAVCGKGDEDYQEIKGVKYHFSDREEIEKIINIKE